MNAELEAIKDAWDKDTGDGRDESARQMADAYVEAHPEQFEPYEALGLEELVNLVSIFRSQGMEESQWRVETWLLHRFEPQQIGGTYRATVRQTGAK